MNINLALEPLPSLVVLSGGRASESGGCGPRYWGKEEPQLRTLKTNKAGSIVWGLRRIKHLAGISWPCFTRILWRLSLWNLMISGFLPLQGLCVTKEFDLGNLGPDRQKAALSVWMCWWDAFLCLGPEDSEGWCLHFFLPPFCRELVVYFTVPFLPH